MWGAGGHDFPFGVPYEDEYRRRYEQRRATAQNGAFQRQFRCYPVSFIDRSDLENGDKIVLPPSALDTLTRLNITFPMLFKLTSRDGRSTHCGVQEFVAEEGHANLPYWQMQNLLVSEGAMIQITNVNLPKGEYVKFQPQTSDFLKISNPKAVLEATLRSFTCLTEGDTIAISYNDRVYYIDVKKVAPGEAISIIETDVNVEFEAPQDYIEPEIPQPATSSNAQGGANSAKMQIGSSGSDPSARIKERLENFKKHLPQGDDSDSSDDDKPPPKPLFPGSGQALKARSGRSNLTIPSASNSDSNAAQPSEKPEEKKPFVPFAGQGRSLR